MIIFANIVVVINSNIIMDFVFIAVAIIIVIKN